MKREEEAKPSSPYDEVCLEEKEKGIIEHIRVLNNQIGSEYPDYLEDIASRRWFRTQSGAQDRSASSGRPPRDQLSHQSPPPSA